MIGGLRVALRTRPSSVASLTPPADPRARAEDTAVNITFLQGGAQEPQSGFLDGVGGGFFKGLRQVGVGFWRLWTSVPVILQRKKLQTSKSYMFLKAPQIE